MYELDNVLIVRVGMVWVTSELPLSYVAETVQYLGGTFYRHFQSKRGVKMGAVPSSETTVNVTLQKA